MITVYRENAFDELREEIIEVLEKESIDLDSCAFIVVPEDIDFIEDAEYIAEKLSELDMSVVPCYGSREDYQFFAVMID